MRGINAGGKNKVSVAALKTCLEELGCQDVRTFIQSGNVVPRSDLSADALGAKGENILPAKSGLDSSPINILALTDAQFRKIVDDRPKGFGDEPVFDGEGRSRISAADMAIAIADETEKPAHRRARFTAGY